MDGNADLQAIELDFEQLTQPGFSSLKLLVALHWAQAATQLVALAMFHLIMGLELPYGQLSIVIGLFIAWNVYCSWRLRRPIHGHGEWLITLQLIVATVVLTALLYLTGGATNPFVSLYVIPIALAAITLPLIRAVQLTLLAIGSYSLLLFFYKPLSIIATADHSGFGLHVIGMWVNFLVSAAVCVVALSFLASFARSRAERVARLREQMLQDARVTELGGLAAGAAHALSTPLSTVAIVLDQLQETQPDNASIDIARKQIDISRAHLSRILETAHADRLTRAATTTVTQFVQRLVKQWNLLYPDMLVELDDGTDAEFVVDAGLEYALTALLDNAADANRSRGRSRIIVRTNKNTDIFIEVEDEGGGPLPPLDAESTKDDGAGVGLLISRSNVFRLGGELMFRMGDHGCIARIRLPTLTGE